jgi:rhodanese-related sulfurtransferase
MIKKIIIILLTLQALLLADFKGVDTATLEKMMKEGVPVIDIRTPEEWKEGVIPGAHKIMFFDENGNYDIPKFMHAFTKVVKDKNQPFVLVCRTASRTKMVGIFLANDLGYTKTRELSGGMVWGWNNLHKPVEK